MTKPDAFKRKKYAFLYLFFFLCKIVFSQENFGPIVSFYFSGNANDTIYGIKGVVRGATLAEDRFGNENCAYSFDGKNDYINLGTHSIFKQITLSISLWAKINDYNSSSFHYENQPFIVTKVNPSIEYNEAYFMGMYNGNHKFDAACTSSEKKQISSVSSVKANINTWHHIVYMFDTDSTYLYVDGKLNEKKYKGFFTNYMYTDSVLLGYTWSEGIDDEMYEKNFSWLNGSLDDIKFFNRILSSSEIEELYNEADPSLGLNTEVFKRENSVLRFLKKYWYIALSILLAIILSITLVTLVVRLRIKRLKQRYKEKSDLERQLMQMEMQALRSQMNPHFIFNAINSIQHYVLTSEKELANKYLIKFSKLIRNVLELSKQDQIDLMDELETIQLYVELESLRFEKEINFTLNYTQELTQQKHMLPPLLIQPFVENAIWHGLLLKEGKKELTISIYTQYNDLIIEINDNGIGREAAGKFRKKENKRKSLGMEITQSRVNILEKVSGKSITIQIIDKKNEAGETEGTKVLINLKSKKIN